MSTVPSATISRLVTYLRVLGDLEGQGVKKTSSDHLADQANVSAFQVRKDLAYFGRFGTRGAGYIVPTLRRELRRILGLTRPWSALLMGVGRLGHAIAHYPNFDDYDFSLKACFDTDPDKVGTQVAGFTVLAAEANVLEQTVLEKGIDIGIIATPQQAAQDAADALAKAGVHGILNFAPTVLSVEPGVHVENVDFLAGLKRLSFYIVNPQLREELA
ncbi:MAG: redox-sensing transcriptional repressor Rex [Deinococcota bacterium]